MARGRITVEVTEERSRHGHPMVTYTGPARWAIVFVSPRTVIVRRGTVARGDIPPEASMFALEEVERAHSSARRYARRRV